MLKLTYFFKFKSGKFRFIKSKLYERSVSNNSNNTINISYNNKH